MVTEEEFIKEINTTYKELNKNSIETYCPAGWRDICLSALAALEALRSSGKNVSVMQIKEKFANFRFYLSGADSKEASELIAPILDGADAACMVCGEAGERTTSGWEAVYCKRHPKNPTLGQPKE